MQQQQQRTEPRHDRSQSHDVQYQTPLLIEPKASNGANYRSPYELYSGPSHATIGAHDMSHAASFTNMAHSHNITSFLEPIGIQQQINSLMNQPPASRGFMAQTTIQAPHHSRANSDSAIYSITAPSYSPEIRHGISSVLSDHSPSSSSPIALPSGFDAHRCRSCATHNWAETQSYPAGSFANTPSHVLVGAAQALQPYAQSNVISPSFNEAWNGLQTDNAPRYLDYIHYPGDLYYYSGQDRQEAAMGLDNIDSVSSLQPFMTQLYPYGHPPLTSPPFSLSPSISPSLQPSLSRAPSMTPPTMHLPLSRTTGSSSTIVHTSSQSYPARDQSASPLSFGSNPRGTAAAASTPACFDPITASTLTRFDPITANISYGTPTPLSDPCPMTLLGPGCHATLGGPSPGGINTPPEDVLEAVDISTVSLPGNPTATPGEVTVFINASFPTGTPNYQALRVALRAVLYSKWKADDELEPGAYHLRQFVAFSRNEGRSGHARGESSEMRIRRTRWMCLFYVMDAQGESIKCRCSSTRSIQALEHVRRHIKLEPFVCRREPCPENPDGCGARYSSMDPLRKHKRGRAKCRVCLREVLPGNMKRHLEVNCHEDDSS